MILRKLQAALVALLMLATPALAVDCSGTITAGAKTVFSTSNTQGFFIVNNSANLMCMSFSGTAAAGGTNCAQGSIPLQPGGATTAGGSYFQDQRGPTAVSITSAGGSDIYTCWRW